jgi:two-component system KDP operon response regulator KdpE
MSAITSTRPSNVLVVDDEAGLRKIICTALGASGFIVEEARHGQEALAAIQLHRFDLVLLDINMPGLSGVETCRQIRLIEPSTGIIMLTVRDGEEDRVRALDAGADDYVTKPFRFRELKARLGAVLRRIRADVVEESGILRAGSLKLDLNQRTLWKAGRKIHLSRREFDLLSFLMKSRGAPLTHAKLLRAVWGPECGNELEYLRTYMRLLRKKIEDDPGKPQYLLTDPWVGYRFRDPSDPDQTTAFANGE